EAVEQLVPRLLSKAESARGPSMASVRQELEARHAELAPESVAFAARVQASIERETRPLAALVPPPELAPAEPPARRGSLAFFGVLGVLVAGALALDSGKLGPLLAPAPPPPS